jgi:uncharacterized protein (DUF58 family)
MTAPDPDRQALIEGRQAGSRYRLALPREAMRGPGGNRLGRGTGSSLDFQDYRDYQPGDDLRHLDWNVFARTDRKIVKLFREEVDPHLDLLLDATPSMRLPGTPKRRAALALAALLAAAAANARCSHRLWLTGRGCQPHPGSNGPPDLWPVPIFDAPVTPDEALRTLPPRFRPHGFRIVISDLLFPGDPANTIRLLADRAAGLVLVQLLAREETDAGPLGTRRLDDVESGERLHVEVDESVRRQYRAALAAHQDLWSRACRQAGAALVTLTAEEVAGASRLPALEKAGLFGAA